MKPLLLAAAFATVLALPATAEDTVAPVKPEHNRGELREKVKEERKVVREGFMEDMDGVRKEHKAEFEAEKKALHEKLKAATTGDERKALIDEHRAKMDANRKAHFDKKSAMIKQHRAEVDARHADMKIKHEEMQAKRKEHKAKRESAPPVAE